MPKTTPFFERLDPLNQTCIWKNWSGYLVASKYQYSISTEYYAIRNSVSVFDTSPLFKYQIKGVDSGSFLKRTLSRDISDCELNEAQYTVWCDKDGFVVQDGVILRVSESEFWLTSAEPSLRYLRKIARDEGFSNVVIEDISTQYGILAIQGPLAHAVVAELTAAATSLNYFQLAKATIASKSVVISRTGFTGDLGYEVWVKSEDAVEVWDAIMKAGSGHNICPIGSTALKMSRVEAGLLLLDVDFHSSRYAWVDAQRETPLELGWGWMFRKLANDKRDFIGRNAIESELKNQTSRWKTVGLEVDWHRFENIHLDAGIPTPKYEHYREETMSIYRRGGKDWDYAGYASSFLFSSLLKKPIAIAKLPLDLAKTGTEVDLELPVIRQPKNVLARVTRMPFYNPKRKTASMSNGESS